MKNWIVYLAFLSSLSSSFACGPWYPHGEDIRFSILDPALFDNGGFCEFYYSAKIVGSPYEFSASSDQNTNDWWELIDKKLDRQSVFEALYKLSSAEVSTNDHEMIRILNSTKGKEYTDYLIFAKEHSHLNNLKDYWEREKEHQDSLRRTAALRAENLAESIGIEWLARRYAFLALRYYFYNHDTENVKRLYQNYFKGRSVSAIDRWAEYHYLWYEDDPEIRNYRVAQLFSSVPSKRKALKKMWYKNFRKEDLLKHAESDEERANILCMYIIQDRGRTLNDIKTIYDLSADNKLLKILIIREVNKLENWVLGPKYTEYDPVIHPKDYDYDVEKKVIHEGILDDKRYAKELYTWLDKNASNLDNITKATSLAVLSVITEDYEKGIRVLSKTTYKTAEQKSWKNAMLNLLNICSTNNPKINDLKLDHVLKSNYKNKETILFTMAREFEFKENLETAFLLMTQLKGNDRYYSSITWAESSGRTFYNTNYYARSFDYFNANYTAKEVENCLTFIEKLNGNQKYKAYTTEVLSDKYNWLDLIGTKYLREEKLHLAKNTWKEIPKSYWSSDYHNYTDYLDANPFYAHFYSNHKPTKGDTISYTKPEVVSELIDRIDKSKNLKGNDKALALFHIANCYYNMTQYGNSWMMKRYYWSAIVHETVYVDNDDYNRCVNAIKYYIKAKNAATNEDFKALCLRMAGRCESYKKKTEWDYKNYPKGGYADYHDYLFKTNTYYQNLIKEFPDDYDQLISNCQSFDRYYNSVR